MLQFIRYLIAIIVGAVTVFFIFSERIKTIQVSLPTDHYIQEYIVCIPTEFAQQEGSNQVTITCRRGEEFDEIRETIESFPPLTGAIIPDLPHLGQ